MQTIGAKDRLDKALVKQYSKVQTNNFDNDIKIAPDEMWNAINMMGNTYKMHIALSNNRTRR